ncbi:hypothetical protein ACJMK2_026185, partial [Sinanodonta woodiana]
CQMIHLAIEPLCCQEVEMIEKKKGDLTCITLHESLIANCLNRYILEVSLFEYLYYHGNLDDNEPIH